MTHEVYEAPSDLIDYFSVCVTCFRSSSDLQADGFDLCPDHAAETLISRFMPAVSVWIHRHPSTSLLLIM